MSETRPSQQCPICGAGQPLSSRKCSICGAMLPGELTPIAPMPPVETRQKKGERPRYDPALGDDDLFVGDLSGRMWRLMLVGGVLLALVLGLGLGLAVSRYLDSNDRPVQEAGDQVESMRIPAQPVVVETLSLTLSPTLLPTNTLRGPGLSPTWTPTVNMMLGFPTVTPVPPSPTITPTPEPCYQKAQAGDTIFEMAARCGHGHWDIVDVILDVNNMESATELQQDQTLEIPWPTPTAGGEPPPQSSNVGGEQAATVPEMAAAPAEPQLNEFGTPDRLAQYQNVEPTLRPGQAWHTVQSGETIMGIAYQYDVSVELLSQINPEIPFLQCDFGETYGGPNCSVMLFEGGRLRVPVPVSSPTPTATPGTRTPTPTPTATYNAPYLIAPESNAHFNADQIVTLRWGGTGTLATNERYIVRVYDRDTGESYLAMVVDTIYILPGGWQPDDLHRHTLEWTISIGMIDADYNIVDEVDKTDPRYFTWDSR